MIPDTPAATTLPPPVPPATPGHHEPARRADRAWTTFHRVLLPAALVGGVMLRLIQYAGNRSLWLDEALVAENVLGRGWTGLFAPLHGDQVAPPGFLLATQAATALLGDAEWALRAIAFACAVAALLLFPAMARRWVGPVGVAWGTAVLAAYPYLIYFASELKPYSGDALATVLLLRLAPITDAQGRRPPVGRFVAAGAVVVWFSYPAVFVLAAIAAAALLGARRESPGVLLRRALPHLAWAASFAGVYLLTRSGAEGDYVRAWWRTGFAPLPTTLDGLAWYPRAVLRFFRDPLGRYDTGTAANQYWQPAAAMLAAALGTVAFARRRAPVLLVAAALAGALLAASALRLFPLGADREGAGRVLLFVAPLAALLAGAGVEWLAGTSLVRRVAAVGLGLAVAAPLVHGTTAMVPHGRVEVRPLVEYVARHRQPGDAIYVFYEAAPAFRYYAPRFGIAPGEWVEGVCARLDPRGYVDDVARLDGRTRVWTVFAGAGLGAGNFPERALVLRKVGMMGALRDWLFSSLGELYLFDFTAPPMTPDVPITIPPLPQDPENGCVGPWAGRATTLSTRGP